MKNKKYHFDMKSQNYNAINNTNYLEHLDEDRDIMLETLLNLYSHRPEHVIDVLIPVLYSYCISVCMAMDLRSSIEFFDDFRKVLNGEMKSFVTFLTIRKDAKAISEEVKRDGEES